MRWVLSGVRAGNRTGGKCGRPSGKQQAYIYGSRNIYNLNCVFLICFASLHTDFPGSGSALIRLSFALTF